MKSEDVRPGGVENSPFTIHDSPLGSRGVVERARLAECVHCGLCLSACPTYLELGTEMDSPRGRIYLMRELEDGKLDLNADVVRHLDLCLGCRACEPACPSGVRYGELIESARAFVERTYERPWGQRMWRAVVRELFAYRARVRWVLQPAKWAQRAGAWPFVRAVMPLARLLPELRDVPPLAHISPATNPRGRVGLLSGCVAGELCGETNAATVRVLQRNGWTVVTPPAQGCCGALHSHSGDPETARRFARWNIDVFPDDLDAIVVNAAGCGAAMKEYGHLLRNDPGYAARARLFAAKVRDVSELLASGVEPPRARCERTVAYHEACHLVHGQRISDAPRALLRAVPGVDVVPLNEADVCCGSAGSYNLVEPEMSQRLLRRKIDNIKASGATCIASANPGCTLQIKAGLRASGSDIEVLHPVELLDRAYQEDDRLQR